MDAPTCAMPRFEHTFVTLKILGTPDGYDLVAAVLAPDALGADVADLRIHERNSGQVAGRVTDQACGFWPAFASYLPHGFHLIQAPLADFSPFERDSEGVLRTPRDLDFEIVDGFGLALRRGLSFTWYGKRTLGMPRRENIIRVAGDVGPDGFLLGGAVWHARLETLIHRYVGTSASSLDRILDWGVGCGRIARHFLERGQRGLHGADIDAVNVEWLQENLNWQDAIRVDFDPPMPYPDGHFDVVYGHSVFTHLTEDDQFVWLREIHRVLRPQGFAFVTACTEPGIFLTRQRDIRSNAEFIRQFTRKGFFDFEAQDVGVDTGREGYYRLVVHAREYIIKNWSRYFIVRRIFPCFMEHQDLIVLQKSGAPAAQ